MPNNNWRWVKRSGEIENLFNAGADKITLNTLCFENPSKVKEIVNRFGSQAVTASIDVRLSGNKKNAWIKCGSKDTGFELTKAINHVKELGVGEILLSSIENDGAAIGYDNKMMESSIIILIFQ